MSNAVFDFDGAAARLKRAIGRLEGAMVSLLDQMDDNDVTRREIDVLIADRARMAEELDASLAREKELEEIADEASAALGAALAEVRAVLGQGETD